MTLTDFDASAWDILRFHNTGGAVCDPARLEQDAIGFRISYGQGAQGVLMSISATKMGVADRLGIGESIVFI